MKTSAELKLAARKALLGNYGNASGAVVVMQLVGIVLIIPFFVVMVVAGLFTSSSNMSLAVMISFGVILAILYMLLFVLLGAGYLRLCYRIVTDGEGEINDLFFVVKNHFLRFIGLMALFILFSALSWMPGVLVMILFSAGGGGAAGFLLGYPLILAVTAAVMCRYAMAPFAMIEDPEMRVMESLRFSRDLMKGNIWRFIRLELSFFGMYILGYMTAGIGHIWIIPYLVCTNVLFYRTIKEEKYPPVYRSAEEEALYARFDREMPGTEESVSRYPM